MITLSSTLLSLPYIQILILIPLIILIIILIIKLSPSKKIINPPTHPYTMSTPTSTPNALSQCIQCSSTSSTCITLQCHHNICPTCILTLLQLNSFKGLITHDHIYIICNCSPYKNQISFEALEAFLSDAFGVDLDLSSQQHKFKLLKQHFIDQLKQDYSTKKYQLTEAIQVLTEIAKEHKEKYDKFQKKVYRLLNIMKYVMCFNKNCDIEKVSVDNKEKGVFMQLSNVIGNIKKRKGELNVNVSVKGEFEVFKEMKVKYWNDCFDVYNGVLRRNARSKGELSERKEMKKNEEGMYNNGKREVFRIYDNIVEEMKKDMRSVVSKECDVEIVKCVKEGGDENKIKINDDENKIIVKNDIKANDTVGNNDNGLTNNNNNICKDIIDKSTNTPYIEIVDKSLNTSNIDIIDKSLNTSNIEIVDKSLNTSNIDIMDKSINTSNIDETNTFNTFDINITHNVDLTFQNTYPKIPPTPNHPPNTITNPIYISIQTPTPIPSFPSFNNSSLSLSTPSQFHYEPSSPPLLLTNTSLSTPFSFTIIPSSSKPSSSSDKKTPTKPSTTLHTKPSSTPSTKQNPKSHNTLFQVPSHFKTQYESSYPHGENTTSLTKVLPFKHKHKPKASDTEEKTITPTKSILPKSLKNINTSALHTKSNTEHNQQLTERKSTRCKGKRCLSNIRTRSCDDNEYTNRSNKYLMSFDTDIHYYKHNNKSPKQQQPHLSTLTNEVPKICKHSSFISKKDKPSLDKVLSPKQNDKLNNLYKNTITKQAKEIYDKLPKDEHKPQQRHSKHSSLTKQKPKQQQPITKLNPNKTIRYSTAINNDDTYLPLQLPSYKGIKSITQISPSLISTCVYDSPYIFIYSLNNLITPLYTLQHHTQQVNTVIPLQPNEHLSSLCSSSLIASASNDSCVVIWNVSSKKKLRSLKDNSKCEITSLLQIDVNTLASSSFWNVKIWDLTTFNEKFNLIGHSRDVTAIINVNCSLIASSSLDGTIKIWNVDAKDEMFTIYGYKGVKCLVDIGKNRFAFAGDDNSVLFYNNGIFKQEICIIKTI